MAPKQSDYGSPTDEAALVPGSLIAYRHFGINLRSGHLSSLGMGGRPGIYSSKKVREWEAECLAMANAVAYHDSPEVRCRCGFYAHYAPDTDFYKSISWVSSVSTEALLIDSILWHYALSLQVAGCGIVRAVVELSGKVVMGRLGVRAEKMRIKALAIDWGKHASLVQKWIPANAWWGGVQIGTAGVPGRWGRGIEFGKPENSDRVCSLVERAAHEYGAEYFDSAEDMYAAYPQPDLSALGIKSEQPERKPSPSADTPFAPPGRLFLAATGIDRRKRKL